MPDLLSDVNVPFQSEGHKHCRPGWINMACPFCVGNPGLHLGWNLDAEHFRCWRCGWHPIVETVSRLSSLSPPQVRDLLRQYGGRSRIKTKNLSRAPRAKAFKFPSGAGPLQPQHRKYLEGRYFDPDELEREWGLLGTGPVALLDERDYKHRIIAPIRWDGEIVSFQGRSISSRTQEKYKACPKDRELIHHRNVLYGRQEMWEETGICVEGITDVWRLGPLAFAVFGINFNVGQVKLITSSFRRVVVLFDDDPQAGPQADKMVGELRLHGVDSWKEVIKGDPGGMKQDDADHLVRQVKG